MQVIFHGKNRQYYEYDGAYYTATFPALWAETHLPGTGPNDCEYCREQFGSWNGVFIGYCTSCAAFGYNGERGFGFYMGEELLQPYTSKNKEKWIRASDTYLCGISLDDIGDPDIFSDSRLFVEKEFHSVGTSYMEGKITRHCYDKYLCNVFKDVGYDEIEDGEIMEDVYSTYENCVDNEIANVDSEPQTWKIDIKPIQGTYHRRSEYDDFADDKYYDEIEYLSEDYEYVYEDDE
jgi:hypothetical protein